MTYAKIQLQLQDVFNKLTEESTKLTEAKNKALQNAAELVKLQEDADSAIDNYKKAKKSKVISTASYLCVKAQKETANAALNKAKFNKAAIDRDIKTLSTAVSALKQNYEEIEVLLKQSLNNVEVFYARAC